MTCATLLTCIPREATSVATSTRNLPFSNPLRAPVRWDCVRSPWIIAAANPSRTRCLARRSVPCLVRAKTNVWPFSAWKKQTQNFQLFRIRHFEGLEFDGVRRPRDGTNSHSHGLVHVIVYQVGDRGFQSGREAQCLALARQRRYDAANGRHEAHVEHAVSFIQNECLHLA